MRRLTALALPALLAACDAPTESGSVSSEPVRVTCGNGSLDPETLSVGTSHAARRAGRARAIRRRIGDLRQSLVSSRIFAV